MQIILRALAVVASAVLGAWCSAASAGFPERPVRIIIGFTPGGPADAVARSISDRLAATWGQPVVIENSPGAAGAIAAAAVARAPADGHTLLLADASSFVVLPHLRSKLPFDPRRDFSPVSVVARQVPVLAIRGSAQVTTVQEAIALARARPNGLTYGTWGVGTWSHVKMEELGRLAGVKLVHVPYRGAAQVITDMLGDRIDIFMAALGLFEQYESSGGIKVLASAMEKRPSFRPELPTIGESAVAGFSASVWFGLVAPAGTPADVVGKINADIKQLQAEVEYKTRFLSPQRLQAGTETPDQFRALVEQEYEGWRETVRAAAIPLTD